jgi:hypothetical protein
MAPCSGSLFGQVPSLGNCTIFPANNVWNVRVDSLPVDANSGSYVQTMGATAPLHPDFGAGGGFEYALVPASQPKYTVSFYYNGDPGPYPIPNPPPWRTIARRGIWQAWEIHAGTIRRCTR